MKDSTSRDSLGTPWFGLAVQLGFSKFFGSDGDTDFEMPCH
jgi:hypothetical protein